MVFGQKLNFGPKKKAFQEEQNGANFSSVAPSSVELWARKEKHVCLSAGWRYWHTFESEHVSEEEVPNVLYPLVLLLLSLRLQNQAELLLP